MIEDLEVDLTKAPIDALNTKDSAVAEEANSEEAITAAAKASNEMQIDLKEEQKTEAYIKIMNIDIENINTIVKRNKPYTKQWRTIYEVIQRNIFDETDIFPKDCCCLPGH